MCPEHPTLVKFAEPELKSAMIRDEIDRRRLAAVWVRGPGKRAAKLCFLRKVRGSSRLKPRFLIAYNLFANLPVGPKDTTLCRTRSSHLLLYPDEGSFLGDLERQLVGGLLRPI